MPLYELTSNITIGGFQFSGVHEVRVQRSIHSYEDRATIEVPTIAFVNKNGQIRRVITSTLFKEGDPVYINLGYNGNVDSEFRGFVKRKGTGLPLRVDCEGYSWQLRNNVNISGDYRTTPTTAKALLQLAVKGTDIKVECPVDFSISGIKLVKFNGLQICDVVKKVSDNTLTIFFSEPDTLWCGLIYSGYAQGAPNAWGFPTVGYRLGWNCIRDNGLKERVPDEPTQVIFKGKYATGSLLYNESTEKTAKNKYTHLSSQIGDSATMGRFAQEKAYHLNYTGYEGKLTGFLQPRALPGFDAQIINSELPDLNGTYLIEGVDIEFGVKGARRKLMIGPRNSAPIAIAG